jgi:hypothetical protein
MPAAPLVSSVMPRPVVPLFLVAALIQPLAPATGQPATARAAVGPEADRLSTEMDRWADYLRTNASTDETWRQIKAGAEPLMAQARSALASGRRLLAAQRFLAARGGLEAAAYMQAPPASGVKDAAAFEAEWQRMGGVLGGRLSMPASGALDGVRPAALRALGEAALPQSCVYYDASLEYGRATMPEYGLFYLGSSRAAGEMVDFCRSLSEAVPGAPPPVRPVRREIEALEAELLDAYRPPLSVDRHPDFIAASAQLKEARELDAAGLSYGALLRYLQAAQRFFPLRVRPAAGAEAVGRHLGDLEARLSSDGRDHSLARLFLERAQEALAACPPDSEVAQAIASDVLPRYLAALEPAPPEQPPVEPRFTVTLVRWPYT